MIVAATRLAAFVVDVLATLRPEQRVLVALVWADGTRRSATVPLGEIRG